MAELTEELTYNDISKLAQLTGASLVNYCPAVEQSTVCTSRNSAKLCRSLTVIVYHG